MTDGPSNYTAAAGGCDEPGAARGLDVIGDGDPSLNGVQVLHDRLIPGSDCGLEHVVVANHAIIVIRSSAKKGRVKIHKDTIRVGGESLEIIIAGLKARVETVRYRVSGDMPVFGAIFLSRQPKAGLKHFGAMPIGSETAITQHIAEEHSRTQTDIDLRAVAYELSGIFLSPKSFGEDAA